MLSRLLSCVGVCDIARVPSAAVYVSADGNRTYSDINGILVIGPNFISIPLMGFVSFVFLFLVLLTAKHVQKKGF